MFVEGFHYLALFAIGGSIVWAAGLAFVHMVDQGGASIEDILLLFIYLELGAMVGMLIGHIQIEHTPDRGIILISGAILLLALATLVIRYGSSRLPAPHLPEESS
jgi:phosphate starvation-inducible membrane PsiE